MPDQRSTSDDELAPRDRRQTSVADHTLVQGRLPRFPDHARRGHPVRLVPPKLESAEHVRDFILRLCLADETEGGIQLASEIWGEDFLPLSTNGLLGKALARPRLN